MRMLAMAPYASMRPILEDICKGYPDITMDVFVGTYDDYLQHANEIDLTRYDSILARGFTAKKLRENIMIPLTEIKLSLYDILRTITMAKARKNPFAIIGSSNILATAHQVIDVLQYDDIKTYEIESESDATVYINQLSADGIHLIIGDVYAVNMAQRANIDTLLVTSSRESLEEAFYNAILLHSQKQALYQQLEIMKEIVNHDVSSVIVFDKNRNIILQNDTTGLIYIMQLKKYINRMLTKLQDNGGPVTGIHKLGDDIVNISGRTFRTQETYYVFYLSIKKKIYTPARNQIQILYPSDELSQELSTKRFELPLRSQSTNIDLFMNTVTVIIGDTGTGKELFIKYHWCNGKLSDSPLVIIDCATITVSILEHFLANQNAIIYNKDIPLVLKNIQELPIDCQQVLYTFLENTSYSTFSPLFVTSVCDIHSLLKEKKLIPNLTDLLVGRCIYLESLNQRTEEIPEIVNALINKYNIELGKEVIALNPDAMQLMKQFQWDNNLGQIKAVVRQLISNSTLHYLSKDEIAAVLKTFGPVNKGTEQYETAGTLAEIERNIISRVLQQEQMNYTKAAKRLGITRATLYRKLKEEYSDL